MNAYRTRTTRHHAALAVGSIAIIAAAAVGWGLPQLGTANIDAERIAQYDPPIDPGVPDESPGSGSRCHEG